MKAIILSLCFSVFSATLFAQDKQQEKIDSVCLLVKKYWAAKDADKIYSMTGDLFQQQLTQENFRDICTGKLFPLGEMTTTFESFTDGINKYKAVFSANTSNWSFYLSLDSQDKIKTFLFKPSAQ